MNAVPVRAVLAARTSLRAPDWREAIRLVAAPLVEAGAITPAYVDSAIAMVENEGPYIVIAPALAIAHARPEAGAQRLALGFGRLEPPVPFGHPVNDPVRLLFVFAAREGQAHVQLLGRLARELTRGLGEKLLAAGDDDALRLLEEVAGGYQD